MLLYSMVATKFTDYIGAVKESVATSRGLATHCRDSSSWSTDVGILYQRGHPLSTVAPVYSPDTVPYSVPNHQLDLLLLYRCVLP